MKEGSISETTDFAVYSADGKRVGVYRETSNIDISGFPSGMYYLKLASGDIKKLVVE